MSDNYPFTQPAPFTAGLPALNQQTDLSQLMTRIAVPMMQSFAGPGGFMPLMSPAQGLTDQHTMSTHQRNMQANTYNTSAMGNDQVTKRLVGMASAVAGKPLSDMSKQQAEFAAGAISHPVTKAFLGSVMGPENLEGILHGQKGDVSALAASTNRLGYFRKGPSGRSRMSADEMTDFSRDMYSELYEPDGNVDEMVSGAAAGKATSIKKLQKAAGKEHLKFVKNADIETRLTAGEDEEETTKKHKEVSRLYKKYVAGGEETDVTKQAAAITKIDRAVAESKVLQRDETTVGQLKTSAETASRKGMHGFSAGQAAGMQDDLYQRGMLPKALGAMTPAERVKMIQQDTPRDDASMTDMARKYGHKELMKDSSYSTLGSAEQSKRLDSELKSFKDKLADTLKEVDKTSSGAKGAKSAVSVEGLGGMDILGSRVDAKRSGAALKSYAGAVAAVREIFGANGNSNAPMPMLLAALDGLSGGAMGQVSSDKIETSLREMNTAAKNAGVGFEELNALSANMQAEGDMRGTAKNVTMQNTVAALSAAQVMRDEGAFSKPRTGAFTQAEAKEATKSALQSGVASTNAKAMGALVQSYNDDPAKYAGTELEAKVKAYQAGHGDYSYETTDDTGKKTGGITKGNINTDMVQGGYQEASNIAARSGIRFGDFNNAYNDMHSRENVSPVAQYNQLIEESKKIASNLTVGGVSSKISEANPNQTDEKTEKTTGIITPAITALTFDSAKDGRDRTEQIAYVKDNALPVLTAAFKKAGQSDTEAAASAKKAIADTELDTKTGAGAAITATNAALASRKGQFTSVEQLAQAPTGAKLDKAMDKTKKEAATNARVQQALGFGSHPLGRLSDYIAKSDETGEKVTLENAIKELTGTLEPNQVLDEAYKEAIPAMIDSKNAYDAHAVTDKYLNDLTKTSAGQKELRERADIKDGVKVDSKKDRDTDYTAHLKTLPDEELKKLYLKDAGLTATSLSPEKQRAALLKNYDSGTASADFDKARYAEGKNLVSEKSVIDRAADSSLGTGQGRTKEERAANQAVLNSINRAGESLANASADTSAAEGAAAKAQVVLGPNADPKQRDALAQDLETALNETDEKTSAAALDKAIEKLPENQQKEIRNYSTAFRAIKSKGIDPSDLGVSGRPTPATHERAEPHPRPEAAAPQLTKMSAEQSKLIKEIEGAKPEDKEALIAGKLRDKDSRELLLTLPDDDMRGMYDKLPEDQKKSTADKIAALGATGSLWTADGRTGFAARGLTGVPEEDAERFARIHDVITNPAPEKTAEEKAEAAAAATTPAAAAEASAAAIPVAAEQAAGTIAEAIITAAETAAATLAKRTGDGLKDTSGHSAAEKTSAGEPTATPAQLADAAIKKDALLPPVEPVGVTPAGVTPASAEPATAALNDLTGDGLKDPSGHSAAEKALTGEPAAASTQVADEDIDVEATLAARKIDKETDPIYASEKRALGETVADINYNVRKNNEGSYVAKKSPDAGDKPTAAEQTTAALENNTDTGLKNSSGYARPGKETPVTQAPAPATAIRSESHAAADVDEDAYGLNDPEAMRRLDKDLATMEADKAADPKYARDTRLLGKAEADSNYNQRRRLQKRADKLPQTGSDTRTGVFKQGELQPEPAAARGDARAESGLRWHSAAGGYFSHPGSDELLKERAAAGLTTTSGLSGEETPVSQTVAGRPIVGTRPTQEARSDALKIPELLQTLATIAPSNIQTASVSTASSVTASVDSAAGPRGGGGGSMGGGGSSQPLKLTGTLSMQGLTAAIISAQAQAPIAAEGTGAPFMPDAPQSSTRTPVQKLR